MRKFIGLLAMFGVLAVAPHPLAFAADGDAAGAVAADQIGIYVAPKFVYGLTHISGSKVEDRDGPDFHTGNHNDSAFGGSIAVGYDFEKQFAVPVRAEIEYAGFSQVEAKKTGDWNGDRVTAKQTYNIHTVFANAYFDIDTATLVTPYVGAGLGTAFVTSKLKGKDVEDNEWHVTGAKTKTNFAWNVGTGVGFDFTDNITLDVGYRFVGLGAAKTKTFTEEDTENGKTDGLYQHQFSTGVRLTF
ncbi:MAG: outer membrane beta-barrel protein [Desulfovibrio sp.]|jgi:opacity protein-like surface antigen|nr:outer membrane beta-barrel protein [Desulfovibrio sp.]